jgi:hypothetical protein
MSERLFPSCSLRWILYSYATTFSRLSGAVRGLSDWIVPLTAAHRPSAGSVPAMASRSIFRSRQAVPMPAA